MFSVSPAELLTIALVALIVFGPKRLPEISKKAGKVLRDLKQTAGELKAGLEAEYDESLGSLGEVRREMRSTLDAVAGLIPPDQPPKPVDGSGPSPISEPGADHPTTPSGDA